MAQMIKRGDELIRINPKKQHKIEYSTNSGKSWNTRYSGDYCGDFISLTDNVNEILANTTKGLYYSKTNGKSWLKRN